MAFSGDLRNISLADVFQNVAGNRVTGTLQIKWRSNEHFVRFENGLVTGYSTGFGKGLPFLDFVQQRQWVEPKKIEWARKKRGRSRKPMSRMLVELKVLSEEDVRQAVATMVQERIYDLMLLKEARFELTEGDPPSRTFDADQRAADVALDVGPLLMEGARRCDEWERIHRIVTSDHDLFVLLEGWEDCELDDFGVEVAEYLDGHTPVSTLLESVPAGRFEILKVVADLVMEGGARPATADEVRARIGSALSEKRIDDAESLLRRALELERSNAELRKQLSDLLADQGRNKEAAHELALLGYQASQEERIVDALSWYDLAIELDPDDLVLRERRLELVAKLGEPESIAAAAFDLVEVLVGMGLAERGRTVLKATLERPGLKRHFGLQEKLAEVEASIGDTESAARRYLELANHMLPRDEARGVELLRAAHDLRPDDDALAERIADIESGRDMRRRKLRRRITTLASAAAVLVALGVVGLAEILAAWKVQRAFGHALQVEDEAAASAEAIRDLMRAQRGYVWAPAQSYARALSERFVDAQLARITELIDAGRRDAARQRVEALDLPELRDELGGEIAQLRATIAAEDEVEALVDRARIDEVTALEDLRTWSDPKALGYLLRTLLDEGKPSVRRAMLEAVVRIDRAVSAPVLARVYVEVEDEAAAEICRDWFDALPGRLGTQPSPAWTLAQLYLEDRAASDTEVIRDRARTLLARFRPRRAADGGEGAGAGEQPDRGDAAAGERVRGGGGGIH